MDAIETLKSRRSVTFFEPNVEISDSKLLELISLANLSPSSMNLQPWKVLVVKDKEKKALLRKCAFNQPKVEEASAVFIVMADPASLEENIDRTLESWISLGIMPKEKKESYIKMGNDLYGTRESEKRKIFSIKNTSFFAMSVMYAAKAMGLESHPMDGFDSAALKTSFNISQDKEIPLLIAIGYPKKGLNLGPRAFRRDVEEFVKVL